LGYTKRDGTRYDNKKMNRKSRKLKTKIYQKKRMIYSMNSLLSRSSFVPS